MSPEASNGTSSSSSTPPPILTEETVPSYLAQRSAEIGVFSPDATLTCSAIVGGNVNYAFRVEEPSSGKTVFVKQAPEYVAIFGPDGFPLTSDRMREEVGVYEEWRAVLGKELSEKYLPTIYLFDDKNMVIVMEFFDGHTLLDHDLVDTKKGGVVPTSVAAGLGEFIGRTHAATHSSKVTPQRKAELTKKYENRAMRDVQLEFVFTKCYKEATDEQRSGLTVDEKFMAEIEGLKSAYNGDNAGNLVLSHGDLHPGSVMVDSSSGSVKVIDPEFTVYGPPGLDVGSLLSGYVLAAVHQSYSDNPDAVVAVCEGAGAIWDEYTKAMREGGISDELMEEIESESVGFAVAEVCRTAMEFAGGRKWLQFDDAATKAEAKRAALQIVERCMARRRREVGGVALLQSEMKALALAKGAGELC